MTIERAIAELRKGEPIVVLDDKDRENEGDIVVAAQFCEANLINFMIKEGRGLICVPITKERAEELDFKEMIENNEEKYRCNFTVSVDANGTTTGISAYERALTVKKIVDNSSKPEDFLKPGHIFPLIADKEGLLKRRGHTEASIELMKLAGLKEVAVICEIMNDDGTMAREKELKEFCKKHDLEMVKIREIIGSIHKL